MDEKSKREIVNTNNQVIGLVLFGTTVGCVVWPYVIGVGALTGVAMVFKNTPLLKSAYAIDGLIKKQEKSTLQADADADFYTRVCLSQPFNVCILVPLIEEVVFRIILFSITGPTCDAITVSAFCFGMMHLNNGKGFDFKAQAIIAIINGIGYGILYSAYGPAAIITAHVINNTIASSKLIDFLERDLNSKKQNDTKVE